MDVNVLIAAHRNYYPIDRVPEYWSWLHHHATEGNLKLPLEIHGEIKYDSTNPDELAAWAYAEDVKPQLILQEAIPVQLVQVVLADGYAPDLNDIEIEEIGKDPFLIASALVTPGDRIVVTTEVSKTTKQRAQRRIPDVCDDLGVTWIDEHTFARDLGFSTDWITKI